MREGTLKDRREGKGEEGGVEHKGHDHKEGRDKAVEVPSGVAGVTKEHFSFVEGPGDMADLAMCVFKVAGEGVGGR